MAKRTQNSTPDTTKVSDLLYGDNFETGNTTQTQDFDTQVNKKEPKTVNLSTLLLTVGLSVAVVLMIVFALLFFSTQIGTDVMITIETQAPTIAPTVGETEKPSEAPTEKKDVKKEKTNTSYNSNFNSYLITLYPPTDIYSGPGYEYNYVMTLYEQGVYTIVEECYNTKTNTMWGKLKSGVGWISVYDANYKNQASSNNTQSFEPYLITTKPSTDIYSGPGYQFDLVMTLDEQGVYTIVEECYDYSTDSTWGKLKSGVGWIDLG